MLHHFSTSIGNYAGILVILDKLCKFVEHPDEEATQTANSVSEIKGSLANLNTWVKSIKTFLVQLKDFVAYQDILGPYMSGLSQVSVKHVKRSV